MINISKKNSDIAEICGAIIGDGWIETKGKALYITGHPTEDKVYYDQYLASLFSKNFIKVKPKIYRYWRVYGFGVYKQKIIKEIIKLGIKTGNKSSNIRIPKWIFVKEKFMIAVLRGIFDSDGSFYCGKCYGKYDNAFRKKYHCQPRIQITSISKNLIIDTFKIMLDLGFHPEKIKSRKEGFKCGRNCKKSYLIRLNRLKEIKNWFKLFKLSANPKHISKFKLWIKFGFCPPSTTLEERRKILKGEININSYY